MPDVTSTTFHYVCVPRAVALCVGAQQTSIHWLILIPNLELLFPSPAPLPPALRWHFWPQSPTFFPPLLCHRSPRCLSDEFVSLHLPTAGPDSSYPFTGSQREPLLAGGSIAAPAASQPVLAPGFRGTFRPQVRSCSPCLNKCLWSR